MYREIIVAIEAYELVQAEYLAEDAITVVADEDNFVVSTVLPFPENLTDAWASVHNAIRGKIERHEIVPVSEDLRFFAGEGGPLITTLVAIWNTSTDWQGRSKYGPIVQGMNLGAAVRPNDVKFSFGTGVIYNEHGSYMAPEKLARLAVQSLSS